MQGLPGKAHPGQVMDFARNPFLVIWETTRACDLDCRHCRAEAVPDRDPKELTTGEAKHMLDMVRAFGPIIFVFSGGDAFKRPDILELVEYAARIGLRVAITPATTPLATPDMLRRLKDAGIARIAVSLDGSNAENHDGFRRVTGSFDHGIRILRTAAELGISTQVNTVVSRYSYHDFPAICQMVSGLGIVFWEIFFLVPMGRAGPADVASAVEFEEVFNVMYDLAGTAPFDLKATAAPHYKRVVITRGKAERGEEPVPAGQAEGPVPARQAGTDGIGRAPAVNDGNGFVFISHTGEIFPSGFLPILTGNVRTHDLCQVYRESPLFRELRDKSLLKGKCGVCDFRDICGGSRARAYSVLGDYLEAEPYCQYVSEDYERLVAQGKAEPVEEYFALRKAAAFR